MNEEVTNLINGENEIPVSYCFYLHDYDTEAQKAGPFSLDETDMAVCHTDGYYSSGVPGNYKLKYYARVTAGDWGAAAPGTYTATMTFEFSIKIK